MNRPAFIAAPSFADLHDRLGQLVADPDGKVRANEHTYDARDMPMRGLTIDTTVRRISHVPAPLDPERAEAINQEWLSTERQMGAAYKQLKTDLARCNSKRGFEAARARYRAACKAIMEPSGENNHVG